MSNNLIQPKGSVSKETNIQSIARITGSKIEEVKYLEDGLDVTGIKYLYDSSTETIWKLNGNETGTVDSWVMQDDVMQLLTSVSTYQVNKLDLSVFPKLIKTTGSNLIGYSIDNIYDQDTVGKKLNLILSPYDYGAIADGILHPLSEKFTTLSDAQIVYPFVTSLSQSIDYAALQKCVNQMITRGAAGMTCGGRGQFCINESVVINKTASVNEANKYIDFSGTEICTYQGSAILNNDTIFTNWSLTGVTVDSTGMKFTGVDTVQSKATYTMNNLIVGKKYAVSLTTESYTNTGYLRIRVGNNIAISRPNEYGPGVRFAEFTATATSMNLIIQDDSYPTNPVVCTIQSIDVRECTFGVYIYQGGSAITHGAFIANNLRIVNKNPEGFGGIRTDDINHSAFTGETGIDGFYGSALLMCNMKIWSENNTIDFLKVANCREVIRFSRPMSGSGGLNSFARTAIRKVVMAGCRYVYAFEVATAVYDSVLGPISGNLTANFRAFFMVHGDQTSTIVDSIRVENNSATDTSGIFEYGFNDLRRLFLGNVGPYVGVKLLATGSLSAGQVSMENVMSNKDFRPSIPRFNVMAFQEQSGVLGTGLTYSAGTYIWQELIINCTPTTSYTIGTSKGLALLHGIVEIDVALRTDTGGGYQGSKYTCKVMKGTVFSSDSTKVMVYENKVTISNEIITMTWPSNSSPTLSFTGSSNRSFVVFARFTS